MLIKSIVLKPEYRGQWLGGILALAIAERFDDRVIVTLKPWPMNPVKHLFLHPLQAMVTQLNDKWNEERLTSG